MPEFALIGALVLVAVLHYFAQRHALAQLAQAGREFRVELRAALENVTASSQNMVAEMGATVREVATQLAIMKGLHPHHADPSQFTPSGMSWKAADAAQEVASRNMGIEDEEPEQAQLERDIAEAKNLGLTQQQILASLRARYATEKAAKTSSPKDTTLPQV